MREVLAKMVGLHSVGNAYAHLDFMVKCARKVSLLLCRLLLFQGYNKTVLSGGFHLPCELWAAGPSIDL